MNLGDVPLLVELDAMAWKKKPMALGRPRLKLWKTLAWSSQKTKFWSTLLKTETPCERCILWWEATRGRANPGTKGHRNSDRTSSTSTKRLSGEKKVNKTPDLFESRRIYFVRLVRFICRNSQVSWVVVSRVRRSHCLNHSAWRHRSTLTSQAWTGITKRLMCRTWYLRFLPIRSSNLISKETKAFGVRPCNHKTKRVEDVIASLRRASNLRTPWS